MNGPLVSSFWPPYHVSLNEFPSNVHNSSSRSVINLILVHIVYILGTSGPSIINRGHLQAKV